MGERVEIRLRDSWEDYPLIPIRKDVRSLFPPYKERFTLIIDGHYFRTNVTGRKSNCSATEGDPEAGTYLRSGIRDIAVEFPEISGGDILTVEKVSQEEYEIVDW